ncbi:hypothetical protein EG329_014455 [Mollisiaceae sp. DMI_Dod_QoI]|nr:hypothetical protein EG329_014455 [Helotiales sp. DMI_Dod_QoI]
MRQGRRYPRELMIVNVAESLLAHSLGADQTSKGQLAQLKGHHKFVRRQQLWKLLSKGFLRFCITIILTVTLLWTIVAYSKIPVLVDSQKRIFNTLVTALSMSLGIAIASSFKQVAVNVRWWILSRKKRPLSEVDAILECDSLTSLTVLAIKSARDLKLKIVLVAQAGVAMIGLTYSLNDGVDYNTSVTGDIRFTDFSQSFAYGIDYNTTAASELAVHTYGEMALAWRIGNLTDPKVQVPEPMSAHGSNPYAYFSVPEYYQYFFMEASQPSGPNSNPIQFYSNRSIKTSGSCIQYPVTDNVNGSSQSFSVTKNGQNYSPIFESIGPNSTTYYTQTNMECGPRCKEICAYENNGKQAFYYECNITVSNVSNVTYSSQNVSDTNALQAAGAIGLQGYQQYQNAQPLSQYQQFPAQSTYGHFVGSGPQMASLMSQFAIGVFVTADKIMEPIQNSVSGSMPLQGVQLQIVQQIGMWAILISIVVSHLVLFILGSLLANRVVVVDGSYLAIAVLLRPVTEKLKDRGFLLGGEKNLMGLEDLEVLYGHSVREYEKDDIMGLEVSDKAICERNPRAWEGIYDS